MSMNPEIASARAGNFNGIADNGIRKFLGIRYAQAAVGDLRFKPPQRLGDATDPVDATQYGNRALQVGWPDEVMSGLEWQGEESEDCLFLNVFAPAEDSTPKPVLVWIHGGAFMCGSGNDYDASTFVSQHDVVVVTINYRIGIFGFLSLDTLGPEHAGSGNLGIQDQIAALRWVYEHIGAFGGDRDNVTIWGESAGAASVMALLGAPEANGLFHKAMAFSGSETLAPATDQLTPIKALLGSDSDDACLARLRELTAAELSQLQQDSMIYVGPSIDGVVITRPACDAIKDGGASDIPILTGATRDEGTILASGFAQTDEMGLAVLAGLATVIGRDDGASYGQFMAANMGGSSVVEQVGRSWFDLFRASALRVAAAATHHGAGGWVYNFEVETDHELGIAHFADVPFTFGWIEEGHPCLYVHPPTDANRELAARWSATIAQFAKTGSPNGKGLPDWPSYAAEAFDCLMLRHAPAVVSNPDGDEMLAIYRVREQT